MLVAPSLVPSYAQAMLQLASRVRDRTERYTITSSGPSLIRWLRRRGLETPDVAWAAAQERIAKAAAEDDVDTAATIAALELPGDPARLRALREQAARELSAVLGRIRYEPVTGALERFLRVLAVDAPELAEILSKERSRATALR